jgi:hypothetical protein
LLSLSDSRLRSEPETPKTFVPVVLEAAPELDLEEEHSLIHAPIPLHPIPIALLVHNLQLNEDHRPHRTQLEIPIRDKVSQNAKALLVLRRPRHLRLQELKHLFRRSLLPLPKLRRLHSDFRALVRKLPRETFIRREYLHLVVTRPYKEPFLVWPPIECPSHELAKLQSSIPPRL